MVSAGCSVVSGVILIGKGGTVKGVGVSYHIPAEVRARKRIKVDINNIQSVCIDTDDEECDSIILQS